jgi:tRNA(fMet)-specific endonuclease VapC
LKYLLDTNVCVDYLSGRYPQVRDRIHQSSPEDLCLSSVVVAELRYGADKSLRQHENHHRIDLLVQEIPCMNFDVPAASAFGQLRAALERTGQSIGPYDMLIAAHALSLDLVLVTDNIREFGRVPGLRLQNWRGES